MDIAYRWLGWRGSTYLGASLLILFLVGCGGKPAIVSGIVTINGNPLDQGTVGFAPVSGGMRAVGLIQGDGSYQLRTNREKGLEVGNYVVTVLSREILKSKPGQPPMPGKYLAPKKYGRAKTSGLSFEVVRGNNTIDIELQGESQAAGGKTRRNRS
ncbi:MAG: hypothetical protein ABGX16_22805 [Pirellulales bacterium]